MNLKQNLDGDQHLDSSFTIFIKRHNTIYQLFWDNLLPQSKTNNFFWHSIKSIFQINKYKKNNLFLALNFSVRLLRKNTASTVPIPDINLYCILSISTTSRKHPSKIFSYSMFQQLHSPIRV